MQVAAAVRDARRAGSAPWKLLRWVITLENGLAERAVKDHCLGNVGHAATLLNLDTVGSEGKAPFERWRGRGHHMGRYVFRERVWYRVGPLTDRTKAEDRKESGMFVGFRMKSIEYIFIANGEAITPGPIRRQPVLERWANPEETCRSGHGADLGWGSCANSSAASQTIQ